MAKEKKQDSAQQGREGVISIIGPGMNVVGDCETEGTLRVEGRVEGSIRAGKAVVVGKDGTVDGNIITQDAVIGGRVDGFIDAESRLELQATCVIEGEVRARRIKLEEGGRLNGNMQIGETPSSTAKSSSSASTRASSPTGPDGENDGKGDAAASADGEDGGKGEATASADGPKAVAAGDG